MSLQAMDDDQFIADRVDNSDRDYSSASQVAGVAPFRTRVSSATDIIVAGRRSLGARNGHSARTSTMNTDLIMNTSLASYEELESLMQRRLGNRVRDLRIEVQPDGIVLQGRTTTYHAKQLAQHAAMELTNLPIVANDIEVC
jgi:hypothetical protein